MRTSRSFLRAGAAAALIASCGIFAQAGAATLKVPDAGAGILTIQDALDAASAGDTILIAPGVYLENLTVSAKPGLVISGAGDAAKVILDARPGGAATSGAALTADGCDGLTVRRLTIRHAGGTAPDSVGIRVTMSQSTTFEDLVVVDSEDEGLLVEGDFASVRDCLLVGNRGGISIAGNGAVVRKSTVRNDRLRGIAINGTDARVDKCVVTSVRGGGGGGISITGDRPEVTRCDLRGVLDEGTAAIRTTGANPKIRKNRVRDCEIGIFVVYGADGDVTDNRVEDCAGSGLRFGGVSHSLHITSNVARRCGTGADAGFLVAGESHVLLENRAQDGAGDGFALLNDFIVVRKNRADGNLKDGFDIDDGIADTVLESNLAEGNQGEGFENGGTGTVLTKNSAKKNRIDFANSGSVTTATGNSFDVNGAPAPEIE